MRREYLARDRKLLFQIKKRKLKLIDVKGGEGLTPWFQHIKYKFLLKFYLVLRKKILA